MDEAAAPPPWGGFAPSTVHALREAVLPQLDDLAGELTELYRQSIPVYEHFDPEVIRRNSRAVLGLVTDQLGAEQPTLTTDGVLDLARDLAEQGTPLGPVAHSVQLGARHLVRLLRGSALELGVSADEIAALQDTAWQWATDSASVIHSVEREVAIAGATRRADFLRRLVAGDLTPSALLEQATRHRLPPDADYRVACAAPPPSGSLSQVVTSLRVHAATADVPVVDAVVDDVLVALLPAVPRRLDLPVPVGVGPALPLERARASYDQARLALDVASSHGVTGLRGLGDLGPLPLVHVASDAADLLDARHLAPLRELGASGQDVLRTVAAYLHHDRRVEETAGELHLHRNTVRYRLTRFATTTGLDLDRTDDLVLAWWLLRRREAAR
ncbi:MAG: Vegetative cell wall protein gp1 [Marmoricola sp.]|nr:Vegetative cell wall protein gp1 [Marmoricola sp.]